MEHFIAKMYVQINGEAIPVGGMPPVTRCELSEVVVATELGKYTTFPFKWIMTQRMYGMLKGFYEAGSRMCAVHLINTEEYAAGKDGYLDVIGFKNLASVDLESRTNTSPSTLAMKHTGEQYVTIGLTTMHAIIQAIEATLSQFENPSTEET